MEHYRKPPAIVRKVANPAMVFAVTKLGIRPGGMVILQVTGRKTGRQIRTPLNPVEIDGKTYLFAPRGTAQWVRNVRAANGEAQIAFGRTTKPVQLTEIPDEQKLPIAREYVRRFYSAVGNIMGIPKDPSDAQLEPLLPNHPVFLIELK